MYDRGTQLTPEHISPKGTWDHPYNTVRKLYSLMLVAGVFVQLGQPLGTRLLLLSAL